MGSSLWRLRCSDGLTEILRATLVSELGSSMHLGYFKREEERHGNRNWKAGKGVRESLAEESITSIAGVRYHGSRASR
jgi:hypothetical protein